MFWLKTLEYAPAVITSPEVSSVYEDRFQPAEAGARARV